VPRRQWIIHSALLIIAALCLPIQPDDSWMPVDGSAPTLSILLLLVACIGAPFFILSTTSPLIQSWQSRTHPDKSPYRLFALSNAGSLLALISYPFLIEPYFSLSNQSTIWSVAFVLFALLIGVLGSNSKHLRPWGEGCHSAEKYYGTLVDFADPRIYSIASHYQFND
jgi:hypothetical protein